MILILLVTLTSSHQIIVKLWFLGPMTTMMNGKVILVGVVSLGRKYCEFAGMPGVGTMISAHRQWIFENSDVQKYQCFD